MRHKPRAVVIDDKEAWRQKITDRLESMEFEVHSAGDGDEGLNKMRQLHPSLVVLDYLLDPQGKSPNGNEVLLRVKYDPALNRIPVLVLTREAEAAQVYRWNADEYLGKGQFEKEFDARVRALLARAAIWPFDSREERTLSLSCRADAPVDMVVGVIEFRHQTHERLKLDVDRLAMDARVAYGNDNDWEYLSRRIGEELHRCFTRHGEISDAMVKATDDVRLNFTGPVEMIQVPMEFLYDDRRRDYLVRRHPFSRSVLGIQAQRPPLSPKLLNDLHRERLPLRVLLVASNTGGLEEPDNEITEIKRILEASLGAKGIQTEVTLLTSKEATLEKVCDELRGAHHVVHYAGHGDFVEKHTGRSSLLFRGEGAREGPLPLSANMLRELWLRDRPCLFYMSCCQGAQTGARRDLLNNDLLGLTDGAIMAGVPAVLGFRWPVSDVGARELAILFYSALVDTGRPDHALLSARHKFFARHETDPAWLSPVLVMQP